MSTAPQLHITEVVSAQVDVLKALADLIEQEYTALRERDADSLLSLAAAKERELDSLRRLEQARRSAAAVVTAAQREEIARLAEHCRARNAANGAMAHAQRDHVKRLLRLLRGDAGADVYGVDGKQKEHVDSRIMLTTA